MSFTASEVVPIFRIFDITKAEEFYVGFLGFRVDWKHRFDDNGPLYMQISRGGMKLHLSEHHGDAAPGSTAFIRVAGLSAFNGELLKKNYRYNRPGIESVPDLGRFMEVHDPFGNRLRFCEDQPEDSTEVAKQGDTDY